MSKTKKILPLLLIFCMAICCFAVACTVNYWAVTFDSDGGTEVEKQTVQDGATATAPDDPTKDGYEFDGWYLNGSEYDFTTKVTENITLTAKWTQVFTVTFNSDGGTEVDAQSIRDGETATEPTAPTKTGYTFAGWYLNGSAYSFSTAVTADITLTAQWTVLTYDVTFNSDGGTEVTKQTVNYGETASEPTAPTREGYTFDGWYLNGSAYSFSTAVTADITLTAQWTINTYTVTFNSDGGTEVASQTVNYGETATEPTAPTREGYTFDGWYLNGSAYSFSTAMAADITLTAQWTIITYTVTFNSDGGTEVASQTVNYGETATEPTAPTREGYTFDGWYLNGSAYSFSTAVYADAELTAQWTINTYTVTFNSDGGTEVASQTVNYGETATEPTAPTKDGCTFYGWYVGETKYDFTTAVTADITLTAQWTPLYTITFNSNGGSEVTSQTISEGETATAPEDPTREGYTFDGWYVGETKYDFTTAVTADVTLTAQWTIITYTVTFNSDGGTEVTAQTINYGETATEPTAPTKDGYEFDGWFVNGSAFDFTAAIYADVELTAQWTQLFTVTFNSDGGSEVSSQIIRNGEKATEPTAPTKSGYDFDGWFVNGSAYDFTTAVTADVTLTAQWTQLFTVTFNSDGGSEVSSQTIRNGETATAPTNPTKTGYTFNGWYVEGSAYDFTTAVTADITLTAQWTINTYTVTFDSGIGTEIAAQTVTYGEKATAPAESLTREYYTFGGWANGEDVYDFDTAVSSDLTLTAVWNALTTNYMLTEITVDASAADIEYYVGEELNTENLVVTVTLLDSSNTTYTFTAYLGAVEIDASEVDLTTAGTYTVYIGYTYGSVTRYASYQITVVSQLSGVHGIELTKTVTEYNVATTTDGIAAIALDDLTVYGVNSDGTLGSVITENITYKYYVGAKEVTLSDLTNEDVVIFQIWASVPYTVGNETYYMQDFVTVEIVGDVAQKFTWKSGTIEQSASYTDSISSTWVLEAEMSLTGAKIITLADLTVGTSAGQYTVEIVTAIAGTYSAVVTYYYALGTKVTSIACEVSYKVTNATADEEYSVLIDVSGSTNSDYDVSTVTPDFTIKSSYSDGDAIIAGMVYAYGSLSVGTENKNQYNVSNTKLYDRVQFSGAKGITVYLGGASTITLTGRYGSSSAGSAAYIAKDSDGNVVATSSTFTYDGSDKTYYSYYHVVTLTISEAGVYTIVTDGSSLNTFRIAIEGKIEKYVPAAEGVSVNINDWLAETANATYAGTSVTGTVTLATGISVWCTDGKTTFATANSKGCIKTGGTMGASTGRAIVVEVQAGATITLTATTGSGGSERYLKMCTLSEGAFTQVGSNQSVGSVTSEIATVTFTATDAGTYYIGSTNSGISIYSIAISY